MARHTQTKRPSYREAIEWIALNDDADACEDSGWLVTIHLVADMFGKTADQVGQAVLAYRDRNDA